MDSPATSLDIVFLDPAGKVIDQPREWTEAVIEVHVDAERWESVRLTVNGSEIGVMLRRIGGRVCVVAPWPRSNAGSYVVQVEVETSASIRRITIQPGKLGVGGMEALLTELESRLPAAVAIGFQRAGGLAGLSILPPDETTAAQELARLRRAVMGTATRPGLGAVLNELARDPHRILDVEEHWTPTYRARRPHPARLMQAVSSPRTFSGSTLPLEVLDQRIMPNVDVFENRLVRLYHDQVAHRLRRLELHLHRNTNVALMPEVIGLKASLSHARQSASFLDEVQPTHHLPTRLSMMLLKHPSYRAVFEGYLEFHRSLAVRLEDPRLDLPLENLPALYQLWGTLYVCSALLEAASNLGYRVRQQRLVHRDHQGAFVRMVPAGKTALQLAHPQNHTTITLIPEQSYGSAGAIRSISFLQVPDITIRIERPTSSTSLLLFDPKYKLDSEASDNLAMDGRPKKVDIDKMHAYRDAIRDSDGRRVVSGAFTIYPGHNASYGPGIGALQGVPGALDERLQHLVDEYLRGAS